jgi:hypothetical protein
MIFTLNKVLIWAKLIIQEPDGNQVNHYFESFGDRSYKLEISTKEKLPISLREDTKIIFWGKCDIAVDAFEAPSMNLTVYGDFWLCSADYIVIDGVRYDSVYLNKEIK